MIKCHFSFFLVKLEIKSMDISIDKNVLRKWLGVLFLLIEMNLLGGTIFGFPAIFKVLSEEKIYQNLCQSETTNPCFQQLKQYQVKDFISKINFCFFYFKECIDIRNCFF
jgi:hypothetical protein